VNVMALEAMNKQQKKSRLWWSQHIISKYVEEG
jgi:hypothetical protein